MGIENNYKAEDGLEFLSMYLKESYNGDVVRVDELGCSVHRVEHRNTRTGVTLQPLDYAR